MREKKCRSGHHDRRRHDHVAERVILERFTEIGISIRELGESGSVVAFLASQFREVGFARQSHDGVQVVLHRAARNAQVFVRHELHRNASDALQVVTNTLLTRFCETAHVLRKVVARSENSHWVFGDAGQLGD